VIEDAADVRAVGAAMLALLAPEVRHACGLHARQLASANSFDANCAAVARTYADIVAARSSPRAIR
jgi:hypothetical protein